MRFSALLMAILSVALLSGCARSPEGTLLTPVRPLTVSLTFDAPINPEFHYYTVIDTVGGDAGPMPVFPGIAPGLGWVTGSATHFVEYYRGNFTLYEFFPAGQFVQFRQSGTPISPSVGGRTLSFTIDLNDLAIPGDSIDVNFITVGTPDDDPFSQHLAIDALFAGEASALIVDLTRDDGPNNTTVPVEQQGDLLDENGYSGVPDTDRTRALDMIDWSIELVSNRSR